MFKPGDLIKIRRNSCIETVMPEWQSEMQWTSKSHIGVIVGISYKCIESLETTELAYFVFLNELGKLFIVIGSDVSNIDEPESTCQLAFYRTTLDHL